jgi:riboflavin biosynthesis pyrimidine reductase
MTGMRVLLPVPAGERELDDGELGDAYAYPVASRWVRASFVASVDGAASAGGRSTGLSGPADKRVFATLRALADVVLVGAGTARTERYRPLRPRAAYADRRAAAGQLPAAAMAVVSGRLNLPADSPLFAEQGVAPTLVITCASAPRRRLATVRRLAEVVVAGDDVVDAGAAVDALEARGMPRILCEGGPGLLGDVAAAGRLDELCLTISPQLRGGDAPRIVSCPDLDPALRLDLVHLLEEDGFLFTRYVVAR